MRHARDRRPVAELAPGETLADGHLVRARRGVAYLLIIAVMGAVAAMSWAGLYSFATHDLGWSTWHAALVPIALDIAAMACALLALDSIGKGETATGFRVLTAAFVALSAFVNWRTALHTGNIAEQVFFPAMSILAYALVHAVMGKARREVRREQHGQNARQALAPLPRTGLLAWLPVIGSPRSALGAVRTAVAERLPETPAETPAETPRRAELARRDIPAIVDLSGLTQADAIRRAIEVVGEFPRDVVAYLDSHGWPGVATQRVYDVRRRDSVKAVSSADEQEVI
jgi:hypothetical protein